MRDNLQAMGAEQRHTFTATFERTGYKTTDVRYATYYQPTLLVNDVTDEQGKVLTDHLWFNYTLGFQKLGHWKRVIGCNLMAESRLIPRGIKGGMLNSVPSIRLRRITRLNDRPRSRCWVWVKSGRRCQKIIGIWYSKSLKKMERSIELVLPKKESTVNKRLGGEQMNEEQYFNKSID
ncbi:hypothetical protein EFT87_10460 [Schleiferilactobacillus harbinensis]|nr:hypothetical protein [Schleiferilactobacillus harbinensis]